VGGKIYFCGGKAFMFVCPNCVCNKIEDHYKSGKSAEWSQMIGQISGSTT
jgi:hypothetical protein